MITLPGALDPLTSDLHFSGDIEWAGAQRLHELPLLLLGFRSHQVVEVGGDVAPQQRLLREDVQQGGQRVGVEPRLQHLQRTAAV